MEWVVYFRRIVLDIALAIESIWDLSIHQPLEHQSNETQIEFCCKAAIAKEFEVQSRYA
ncbi:hypothetical protein [Nostoc sp.]|uniref:hypothetical protein n=1 Tax=Nostoc sp. TaxID=1180 RepID=UPI002FFCCFBA